MSGIDLEILPIYGELPERLAVTMTPVADTTLTSQQPLVVSIARPTGESLRISLYVVYESGATAVIKTSGGSGAERGFTVDTEAGEDAQTYTITPDVGWLGPFTIFVNAATEEGRLSSLGGSGLANFYCSYDAPALYPAASSNSGQFGSVAFTAADLLADIKKRTFAPEDQTTFTDAEMLDVAWKEMVGVIYPKLIAARSDFFSTVIKVSPNAAKKIRLPGDIVGGRIYDLKIGAGETERFIKMVSPHDANSSWQEGFWIENGEIVFTDATILEDSVYIRYPVRPGRFQLSTETSLRYACSGGGLAAITFDDVITDVLQSTNPDTGSATKIDIQIASSPHTIVPLNVPWADASGDALTGLTSDDALAARQYMASRFEFQEGDLAIVGGTCWYVPLPTDCCDWLVQRSALRILEYMNKTEAVNALSQKLADIEKDIAALYAPRSSGNPKTIIGNNLLGAY